MKEEVDKLVDKAEALINSWREVAKL